MKVLATVENGKLIPKRPLRFSRQTLEIEIPDDAVDQVNDAANHKVLDSDAEAGDDSQRLAPVSSHKSPPTAYTLPPEAEADAADLLARLDRIRNALLPEDAELPPLSQKQLDRLEAFALRDELRKGR